ncbi:MAG: VOC family protein [Rhodospirillales bacterium]|nr:VOC family protein [Rhodospirillales bacterium]
MAVQSLDHYTIIASNLERSIEFYTDTLGLRNGERPEFDFPGAWIYVGDRAVVHLLGTDGAQKMADGGVFGGGQGEAPGTGSIHHVAFRAADLEGYVKRLKAQNIPMKEQDVPGWPLHQVFLEDPDGVTIELNFWDE